MVKSPFIVIENFLSPLLCEEIVDEVGFHTPDVDPDSGASLFQSIHDEEFEQILFEKITPLIPELEKHYDFEYKGMEHVNFEFVPTNAQILPQSESSEFIDNKWVKTKARDFCCVIFLSDYNNTPSFDSDFECYGGKLEFINHHFGFNPQRGTMVVYPSDPRFSNGTSTVVRGDLHQIRIHITAKTPYIYNPKMFPGDYRVWFS